MFRTAIARAIPLIALATIACGGGDSVTAPPPGNTTRVLAIVAGQGATGAAGSALATRPAVKVSDAAGAVVAGVQVTFTVDGGGGSIANNVVSSGADGIATAGAWTLGSSPGANALRVSAANATSVVISATGTSVAPPPSLAYSAWKITANAGTSVDNPPPANAADGVLTNARAAYTALKAFWTTPTTGSAIPTLWFVPTATTIGGEAKAANLYISDSLPGTAPGGAEPFLYTYASPSATAVGTLDDATLAPTWTITGTPPSAGTLDASYASIGAVLYVPNHPQTIYSCIGEFNSPYVTYTISFTMSGTTGSGTITYRFRNFTPSCSRPNATRTTWTMVVPFTATRVR